jgi:hypothetical protein
MADSKDDPALKELEDAHEHADPSRGNKKVDGGDRANVSDVDEGAGVKTADKRF